MSFVNSPSEGLELVGAIKFQLSMKPLSIILSVICAKQMAGTNNVSSAQKAEQDKNSNKLKLNESFSIK